MVKIGTYRQALAFLESLWPKQKPDSFNLRGIKAACADLGNPQNRYKTIHVAGTSGKGSVVLLVANALAQAGFRTGAYYSPYLESPRESIQINGKIISEEDFTARLRHVQPLIKKHKLTFFEAKTLLVFDYFTQKKINWAVVEVGLGGRLDATNVVTPEVSVITNIDIDHVEYLGSTIEAIAREKAGIIKNGVPAVCGAAQPSVKKIIAYIAKQKNARLKFIKTEGTYDQVNRQIARATLNQLNIRFSPAPDAGLAGRFEVVGDVVVDGAHNPAKMRAFVARFQKEFPKQKAVVLFGSLVSKNYETMIKILKPITRILVTTQGKSQFHKFAPAQFRDPKKALVYAKSLLKPSEKLIITGSLYLIGELRYVILQRPKIS